MSASDENNQDKDGGYTPGPFNVACYTSAKPLAGVGTVAVAPSRDARAAARLIAGRCRTFVVGRADTGVVFNEEAATRCAEEARSDAFQRAQRRWKHAAALVVQGAAGETPPCRCGLLGCKCTRQGPSDAGAARVPRALTDRSQRVA